MKLNKILTAALSAALLAQTFIAIPVIAEETAADEEVTLTETVGDNLIVNGDFDGGKTSYGSAVNWYGHPSWYTQENLAGGYGVNCVEGRNGTQGGSWWQENTHMVGQRVDVEPEHNYRLTFWYKNNPKFKSSKTAVSVLDADNRTISLIEGTSDIPSLWDSTLGTINKRAEVYRASTEWKEVTIEFQTKETQTVCIEFTNVDGKKGETVYFDDISLYDLGKVPPEPGKLKNGDFSNGLNKWSVKDVTVKANAARLGKGSKLSQQIFVTPNTYYTLRYAYKGKSSVIVAAVYDSEGKALTKELAFDCSADKSEKTAIYNFNSGDNEYITIEISCIEADSDGVCVDNVMLQSGNILTNGDFEDGDSGWTLGESWKIAKGTDKKPALDGKKYLQNKGGIEYIEAKQTVFVEPNTEYTLSYMYKTNKSGWLITKLDNEIIKHYRGESVGEGTENYKFVTKPDQTEVTVKFMGANGTKDDLAIDNVSLVKTVEDLNIRNAKAVLKGSAAELTVILSNSKEYVNGSIEVELYSSDGNAAAKYEEKNITVSGSYVINAAVDIPENADIASAKAVLRDENGNALAEKNVEMVLR